MDNNHMGDNNGISPQFFLDENADLNDMTEEIHYERLAGALSRFWDVQAQEMVNLH